MKKKILMTVKIVVIAALLVALAILIRDASDCFRAAKYDVATPTAAKYAKLAKWIPSKANLFAAVDVKKLLDDTVLKQRVLDLLQSQKGVAAELGSALVGKQNLVGMIAIVGDLSQTGKFPSIAFVAQGAFNEKALIPAIRTILSTGKAGLVSEEIEGHKLYMESDSRNPLGFMVLDNEHIAAGTRDALVELFGQKMEAAPQMGQAADSLFFGHVTVVPRMKEYLPMGLDRLDNIDFRSPDGQTLVAAIHCKDAAEISSYQMFLEGVRSLLLIQQEGNAALTNILKGISISTGPGEVTVSTYIMPLLDLIPQPKGSKEG